MDPELTEFSNSENPRPIGPRNPSFLTVPVESQRKALGLRVQTLPEPDIAFEGTLEEQRRLYLKLQQENRHNAAVNPANDLLRPSTEHSEYFTLPQKSPNLPYPVQFPLDYDEETHFPVPTAHSPYPELEQLFPVPQELHPEPLPEESFLSHESPRPRGPVELPQYDEEYDAFGSSNVVRITRNRPVRHFQELLRSANMPPYPQALPEYEEIETPAAELEEYFHSDETPPHFGHPGISNADTPSRTSQIIAQSLSTPSKIPQLESTALDMSPLQSRKSLPTLKVAVDDGNVSYHSDYHLQAYSSSRESFTPPLAATKTPSPFANQRTSLSKSRSSSPTRSLTLAATRSNGFHDEQAAQRRSKSTRSSRSPSPNNRYGRSPSLMYPGNYFPQNEEGDYENEYDNTYFKYSTQNDSFDGPSPPYPDEVGASRWNSIGSGLTGRTELSDYVNEPIDYAETPASSYFDYLILPELPPRDTTNDRPKVPLNPSISFTNRDPSYGRAVSISNKRKDDALPPVPLDLPQLPFSASSLLTQHFSCCSNVWSLSSIFEWCVRLRVWLHGQYISQREFKKALIKLLVFHRRDVPIDLIRENVDRIVEVFLKEGAVVQYSLDEEKENDVTEGNPEVKKTRKLNNDAGILMDESVSISGVLVDLTHCYCHDPDHDEESNASEDARLRLRCYSSQCHLNTVLEYEWRMKNTNIHEMVLGDDWASHWKLTADELNRYDKTLSKRQSLIFDLLRYEQTFIQRAKCFVELVGPEFIKAAQVLVGSHDIVLVNRFEDDVLKPGEELVNVHEKVLFEPLLKILISDGKFIQNVVEISNIYYEWSISAKNALLRYMSTVPMIEDLLSSENVKQWVDVNVRNMSRVKELKVNGPLLFMSTFNSRYQSLPLQLSDIRKLFDTEDAEYAALTKALDGIKKLGSKVNEMKVHADNIYALKRLHKQLFWKNSIVQPNINLSSENRRFHYRGDLLRRGDLKIGTSMNHIILLDNYLFVTEKTRNARSNGFNYKVVENPIPIEFLLFEIKDKETSSSPTVETNTALLSSPISPETAIGDKEEDPLSFAFKIRYAGRGKHNAFTFFARSDRERKEWIAHLTDAKSNLCLRLKKAEPYTLRLISNSNFAYEFNNRVLKLPICAPHDPMEAITADSLLNLKQVGVKGEVYSAPTGKHNIVLSKVQSVSPDSLRTFKNFGTDIYSLPPGKHTIVYSKVHTVTDFKYRGIQLYFVGLGSGIYCSDLNNAWKKVASGNDISKISVLPELNLVIVLGDRHLRTYMLELLMSIYYGSRESAGAVSLSNEPVVFFSVGRHKGVTMVFYAKKKSGSSGTTNFKVLIPETDIDGVFSTFKVAKKFYVQAECFGISIFNTSFAVHTNKGFEILELDKLLPRSVPEIPLLDGPMAKKIDGYSRRLIGNNSPLVAASPGASQTVQLGIEAIKKTIFSAGVRPMGMYKLQNNAEFLLVYNDCAVFTNKHGKLLRFLLLRFEFRAKSVAFRNNHLFLACDEAIEVWAISDAVKGTNRLIQVITGKDVAMVGTDGPLSFSMANPRVPGLQVVFRLSQ